MRTQVAIIGAGPSGLLLGQLLARAGIDTVILERQTPDYVLGRIRAGVLEQGTVGPARRGRRRRRACTREGLVHDGIEIAARGERHRIDFDGADRRQAVTVYGQTEVTRDLMDARRAAGREDRLRGRGREPPRLRRRRAASCAIATAARRTSSRATSSPAATASTACRRQSVPAARSRRYERVYPFGWLGVLADAPPVSRRAHLRQPRARLRAVQHAFAHAQPLLRPVLARRQGRGAGPTSASGRSCARGSTPGARDARHRARRSRRASRRCAASSPSRCASAACCSPGDAAHIVPPTGAKGLNLAASDVRYLSRALVDCFRRGDAEGLDAYSARCLKRIWKAERFSWWMTMLLHRFPDTDAFGDEDAGSRAGAPVRLARPRRRRSPRTTSGCRSTEGV